MNTKIGSLDARRILCATDFSESAAVATRRAARLAQACGGELELLHVIPLRAAPVYRISGWETDRHEVAAEAMAKLAAMAEEARAKFGVPVAARLALGTPHAQIAARADATGVRLVVAGARPQRSLRDMFIGSTAFELRRALRVPLLIARSRSTRHYGSALVAVDFSPASAVAAHAAARLFPGAALHFVHVCNPPFESRLAMADARAAASRSYRSQALLVAGRELDGFIRDGGLQGRRASAIVKHGYPPACIEQRAAELGATLVVFGTRSRSRLASLVPGVAREFASGSEGDVLFAEATPRPSHDRLRDRDARAEAALT